MIKGNIEEMLSVEGVYITTTAGVSMFPLLRNRKDNAVIQPKPRKLNRFDVVLYKRDNVYILHRIVDIKDGRYIIRGDNRDNFEYDITDEHIIGILNGVYRGNVYISVKNPVYLTYSRLVVWLFPLRTFYKKTLRFLAKIKNKIFKRSN